jgi:FKBP-type peptidyl-prolyl cis-trans isomerase 2
MAEAGEKPIRKKEREPIATVCFVVLLIACVAVLGVFINDNYINKNKETIEYGDSIELNYTGSLYAYYNDKSSYTPVIFDTSVESVGKDTNNTFLASFSKDKYEIATIKVDSATSGSGDFLKAFEDACIGHKVGDTFSFKIDKADAYKTGKACDTDTVTDKVIENSKLISISQYNKLFNNTETSVDATKNLTDVSGLPATVTGVDGKVCVNYTLTPGQEYTVYEKAGVGKVTLNASAVSASSITYTLTFVEKKDVADQKAYGTEIQAIEMISMNLFGQYYNIVGYDGTNIAYNNASSTNDAISDMDLYFVVTIVKKV